jgi:acetyl esterase/lipase
MKSSGSSHEWHSLAFAGRAAHARLCPGDFVPRSPLTPSLAGPQCPAPLRWLTRCALVACVCAASAPVISHAQVPEHQPPVTTDVVYGHKDGLALTLDVHRSARPDGAGLISIVSGGWQSSVELARIFSQAYLPFIENGFTVFAVRHGSWPRYPMSSIVADMRRSVRFIRQHAKEYGVDPNRLGVFGSSAGGRSRCCSGRQATPAIRRPTTRCSGNPIRVAAVAANFPPTDLARWATQQPVFKFTEAEAAQFSPIRFVSPRSAPSLIVPGDADTVVPIDQGETMHAALTKAGVPVSFIRIKGAGHGFEGAAPADLDRATAAMMQWFEQHLGSAAK